MNRAVTVGLVVSVAQTIALAVAAGAAGSAALRTQTITSMADIAGSVFLLVGVLSSARPPDDRHPLGYGRERFFWSFVAAIGIFVGGFGAAAVETVGAFLDPRPGGGYPLGYTVLAVVLVLDAVSLVVALRTLRARAAERHIPVARLLWRGTDPAVTTVVLSSAAGVGGGVLAAAGLAGRQASGQAVWDTGASALISLVLRTASAILLHTDRGLLTGRGLSPAQVDRLRAVVQSRPGVLACPTSSGSSWGPPA